MADQEQPPFGFTCTTCPYKQPMPGTKIRWRCVGAPPTTCIVGQAADGQLINQSFYRSIGATDWCGAHPEIQARMQLRIEEIKSRLLLARLDFKPSMPTTKDTGSA